MSVVDITRFLPAGARNSPATSPRPKSVQRKSSLTPLRRAASRASVETAATPPTRATISSTPPALVAEHSSDESGTHIAVSHAISMSLDVSCDVLSDDCVNAISAALQRCSTHSSDVVNHTLLESQPRWRILIGKAPQHRTTPDLLVVAQFLQSLSIKFLRFCNVQGLTEIARHCTLKFLQRNQIVFDVESVANEVFVIAEGVVHLSSSDPNSAFQLSSGQLFGQEVLVSTHYHHLASVVAVDDSQHCQLICLSKSSITKALRSVFERSFSHRLSCLKSTSYFAKSSEFQLFSAAVSMEEMHLPSDSFVFRQGDLATHAYLITAGRLHCRWYLRTGPFIDSVSALPSEFTSLMQDSTLESSSAVFVRIGSQRAGDFCGLGAAVGLHASTRRVSLYCPEPVTVLQISVQAMKNVIDGSFIDRVRQESRSRSEHMSTMSQLITTQLQLSSDCFTVIESDQSIEFDPHRAPICVEVESDDLRTVVSPSALLTPKSRTLVSPMSSRLSMFSFGLASPVSSPPALASPVTLDLHLEPAERTLSYYKRSLQKPFAASSSAMILPPVSSTEDDSAASDPVARSAPLVSLDDTPSFSTLGRALGKQPAPPTAEEVADAALLASLSPRSRLVKQELFALHLRTHPMQGSYVRPVNVPSYACLGTELVDDKVLDLHLHGKDPIKMSRELRRSEAIELLERAGRLIGSGSHSNEPKQNQIVSPASLGTYHRLNSALKS